MYLSEIPPGSPELDSVNTFINILIRSCQPYNWTNLQRPNASWLKYYRTGWPSTSQSRRLD
ncbi:MAG: hypothetical protein ACLUPL_03490 [Butyricimonas virosa]